MTQRSHLVADIPWTAIGMRLIHPRQHSILELVVVGGKPVTPSQLSRELRRPLHETAYHVRALAGAVGTVWKDWPLLELVDERPVRGGTEHFYDVAPGVLL